MKIILLDFYENIMMSAIIGARIHNGRTTPNNLNKIKSVIIEYESRDRTRAYDSDCVARPIRAFVCQAALSGRMSCVGVCAICAVYHMRRFGDVGASHGNVSLIANLDASTGFRQSRERLPTGQSARCSLSENLRQ